MQSDFDKKTTLLGKIALTIRFKTMYIGLMKKAPRERCSIDEKAMTIFANKGAAPYFHKLRGKYLARAGFDILASRERVFAFQDDIYADPNKLLDEDVWQVAYDTGMDFDTAKSMTLLVQKENQKKYEKKAAEEQKNNGSANPTETILENAIESAIAYSMMKEELQQNGGVPKKHVVFHPEHITIIANRKTMTKGVPADYFFDGDKYNDSATLPLLSPLKININKAVKNGIPGKRSWEGSKCLLVAENDEYRFYNYGCYSDGSGGCTIGQKKAKPKQVLFFGRARNKSCIFHNKLVQINSSAYGTELYLFAKDIHSGTEKIYPWFGKYAIPTESGSRYDQDTILDMKVDSHADSIIIKVRRQYYINPSPDDNELICNADTEYTMIIKADGDDFRAMAEFPELNVTVLFNS